MAEVLITLGIIGVVAAMTLPTLVQSYKKQVLESRIKKFVSISKQAEMMAIAEHGPISAWDRVTRGASAEECFAHYNKYYGKYIKTVSHKILSDSVAFELADGSGFIYYYDTKFCVDYKKCLNIIEKSEASGFSLGSSGDYVDSKNIFLFQGLGNGYEWNWDGTQAGLKQGNYACKEGVATPLYCSKLLELNGWNVPDDYPIKL